jgi:hypothetical protein
VLSLGIYLFVMALLDSGELVELRTRMNLRARISGRRR